MTSIISIERRPLGMHRQQARLFRHLSLILCQLCNRVEWAELDASEKRRLRRTLAGLSSGLHVAQLALRPSRRKAKPCKTTKAAFRKR